MSETFLVWLAEFAPTLIKLAVLLMGVATLPLVALAWIRGIYPHVPLVVLLIVPSLLTCLTILHDQWLILVLLLDAAIFLTGLLDLITLPAPRWFSASTRNAPRGLAGKIASGHGSRQQCVVSSPADRRHG